MMTASPPKHLGHKSRAWFAARVVAQLTDGHLQLEDGSSARLALSCLVQPEPGDQVLCWAGDTGHTFVLHVLTRQNAQQVNLAVPGATEVCLGASRLVLHAESRLQLLSLNDLDLQAGAGGLNLLARHIQITALETLLQSARELVGRCEHWLQQADGVARLHGRQTLLSADEDLRADAHRISMG